MNTENLTPAGKAEFEKTGVMPTQNFMAGRHGAHCFPDPLGSRRWAIEYAIAAGAGNYSEIVEAAQAFVDFVNGTNDAEIVRAARELAEKVKPTDGD